MEIVTGQNMIEFIERIKINKDCIEYLSEIKWISGYNCRKCSH